MTTLKKLLKPILRLFAKIGTGIIVAIVVGLVGVATLISYVTHTLNYVIQSIKSPTPLWATIALVFLVMIYIYLRTKRVPSSPPPNYKTEYFTIDNLKWETKVYDDGSFEVGNPPRCSEHDLPFIYDNSSYDSLYDNSSHYCPEFEKGNCENRIWNSEYDKIYATAKSYINKQIRNKKC